MILQRLSSQEVVHQVFRAFWAQKSKKVSWAGAERHLPSEARQASSDSRHPLPNVKTFSHFEPQI